MIFITCSGEIFLLLFHFKFFFFSSFHYNNNNNNNNNNFLAGLCFVFSCVAWFCCRNPCSSGLELESNGTPKGTTV